MKSRFSIVAILVTAGLAGYIAWVLGVFEPRHGGLSASAYLRKVIEGDPYRFGGKEDQERIRAVPARVGVPILIRLTEAQDTRWRGWYQRLYPKLPQFITRRLGPPKSSDSTVRRAVMALRYYGADAAPSVPQLLKLEAAAKTPFDQASILPVLGEIGPGASNAIPMLLTHFQARSAHTSEQAALALGKIDSRGEQSGALLVSALEQRYQSSAALHALTMMASNEPKWIREIWRVTENAVAFGSPPWRAGFLGSGMAALQRLNALDAERVQVICRHSQRREPVIRQTVAEALVCADRHAETTTPVLLRLLSETNASVSGAACSTLLRYAQSTNVAASLRVTALRAALSCTSDIGNKWQALAAAQRLGKAAALALPEIIPLLSHTNERIRGEAAEAMSAMGAEASAAKSALEPLLKDEWLFVRDAAERALKHIAAGDSR